MLLTVDAKWRIQWESFTIQDKFAARLQLNSGFVIVSQGMLDLMLSYQKWSGVRYLNADGEHMIGYGVGDPDDEQGQTEEQSYAEWIGWVRNRQKSLQAQLPTINITQTVFDGLLSLYIDTGSWRTVKAEEGTYDLAQAVKNQNWLLVADIVSRGQYNSDLRKKEARVIQLGDYSVSKTRNQQVIQGIQDLRKRYVNGINNDFDKRQAEFVYYRQLGSFLPGMSQLRQRRVIAQTR